MSDTIIFVFGFCVTLIVGSALTLLIVQNNRAIERSEEDAQPESTETIRSR